MNTTTINLASWPYHRTATLTEPPEKPRAVPPLGQVLTGDALRTLERLPDASIDCVVTSPPYHLLRRYNAGPDELGTETAVEDYVDRLVTICDELARVLTPTGSLFLNLGDSFSRGPRYGAPAKSLLLAPERLLLRLNERGWRLRNRIAWAKPNPMPNSVADRLSTTWEPIFFLVRADRYHFDLDAIRVPHRSQRTPKPMRPGGKYGARKPDWAGPLAGANDGLERTREPPWV